MRVVSLGDSLEVALQQASYFQVLSFLACSFVLFRVDVRVVQGFVRCFDYLFLVLIQVTAIHETAHSVRGSLVFWAG